MEKRTYNVVNTMACGLALANLADNWNCELDYCDSVALYSDDDYIEVTIACPSIFRAEVERQLAPFV